MYGLGRMRSDSTPTLVYRVKMHHRSCDYSEYGGVTPFNILVLFPDHTQAEMVSADSLCFIPFWLGVPKEL